MLESDSFYEELPFTLQEEHLKSEVLIFGTGLKESLLAAYLSKMEGKQVLIMDQEKTYGSCIKSITLKELYLLSINEQNQPLCTFKVPEKYKKSNEEFFNERKQKNGLRGFNIDIEPSFFLGTSLACECLKQADMDKYLEFRIINNLFNYELGKLVEVPLSKGKIFDSKSLSLMEKKKLLTSLHILMKLYQQEMGVEEDMNSTKEFDKGFGVIDQETLNDFKNHRESHFLTFLEKITKKNKKIMDLIAYVICGYQYDYSKEIPEHKREKYALKSMIERFGKFISSCGVYGETPYLYVDNGVGDIPQAYSRIGSIFGSTFILHPKIVFNSIEEKKIASEVIENLDSIESKTQTKSSENEGKSSEVPVENEFYLSVISNIAPGKEIRPKKIFYGETFHELYSKTHQSSEFYIENVLRIVVLTKKIDNEIQCPSIAYFIGLENFSNPVNLFIFDDSTHICPSGHILYQFSTILNEGEENEIEKKTETLLEKLREVRGQEFERSIEFVTAYIRKNMISKESKEKKDENQLLLRGYEGLDMEGHFEQLAEIVGKKENYFRKKNPYQEEYEGSDEEEGHNVILERLENIQLGQKKTVSETEKNNTSEAEEPTFEKQSQEENQPSQTETHDNL